MSNKITSKETFFQFYFLYQSFNLMLRIIYLNINRRILDKGNINFSKKKEVNKDYFRGEVDMIEVLNNNNSVEHEMYHVFFKKGALTTLHFHETEQILITTSGKGILCLFKENIIENLESTETIVLEVGDVVSIPPFIWHFHGSLKDNFAHIALRNRDIIDSSGKKRQAENVWEKDFVANLSNLNKSESEQLSLKIEQKVNEIVRDEIIKTKTVDPI
jgi:quercetin dioxygenase-like cupin family protein